MIKSIGIDIGSQKTILVADDGEIVRTSTGSVSFPTLISFQENSPRYIGDEAISGDTIISMINLLVGKSSNEIKSCEAFNHAKIVLNGTEGNQIPEVMVKYGENIEYISTTALLGFYIHKLWERITQVYGDSINLSFVTYPSTKPSTVRAYFDASQIAGLEVNKISIVDSSDAMVSALSRKLSALRGPEKAAIDNKYVALIEVGHIQTTCVITRVDSSIIDSEGSPLSLTTGLAKIATEHDEALGSFHFDLKLFDYLAKVCETKHQTKIDFGSKRGNRLLAGCERLRKLLSQLTEGMITVENLTDNGDVSFSMKRDEFYTICLDLTTRLQAVIQSAVSKANSIVNEGSEGPETTIEITNVEILGGGLRMPTVQTILSDIFGKNVVLGAKLDDGSLAIGAALATNRHGVSTTYVKGFDEVKDEIGLSADEITAAKAKELEFQARDNELKQLLAVKNSLESYILEMRSAPKRKFGELIDSHKLSSLLDDSEGWIWDNPHASFADFSAKDTELRSNIQSLCKPFFEAVEAHRIQIEKKLEEEAAAAAAEKEANGEDEDDYDNRKLKKADRMRLVIKNKDEGTELFKGGNYRPAAARYQKSMTHASKFFDLSPDDEAEVKNLKMTLYLNLASCYIKLENWELVLRNCDEAYKIDHKNPKIYFRRSQYYEAKNEIDNALADMKKCQQLMDTNDKQVNQAIERLSKLVNKQKQKEKDMWGKAFKK